MRDDPNLRNRPLAVGGASDRRGVIATCNYEARSFGVHSAMPSHQAKRLCPDLLVIPGNMKKYREVSAEMHKILAEYSEIIEPLSLDEAYVDVSDSNHCHGSATLIAREIRQHVKQKLGITLSAGVAPNKFLAKIASDWQKPNGLTVIEPHAIEAFVLRLPVTKLHGVGRVTAQKLHHQGIQTCADLRRLSLVELIKEYGKFGNRLYTLCRGIDERAVNSASSRKSVSVEHTFATDLAALDEWQQAIAKLYIRLYKRLAKLDSYYQISAIVIKIKYNDFTQMTQERASRSSRISEFNDLLKQCWHKRSKPIRLLGVGIKLKDLRTEFGPQQLPLPNFCTIK